jgi:hypothetical protein
VPVLSLQKSLSRSFSSFLLDLDLIHYPLYFFWIKIAKTASDDLRKVCGQLNWPNRQKERLLAGFVEPHASQFQKSEEVSQFLSVYSSVLFFVEPARGKRVVSDNMSASGRGCVKTSENGSNYD